MKIAILDSNQSHQKLLSGYIQTFCDSHPYISEIDCYSSSSLFTHLFHKGRYDLIFLDSAMPNYRKAADFILEKDVLCPIFMTSETADYWQRGYQIHAVDYLIYPLSYTAFQNSMLYCIQRSPHLLPYLEIKESRNYVKIPLDKLLYTDYNNHYVYLHTAKQIYRTYLPFQDFYEQLAPYHNFFCCYRNCMINLDAVSVVEGDDFLLCNGERLPIHRARRKEILQYYSEYVYRQTAV